MLLVPPATHRKAERLLAMAHIEARWSGPPTADVIRALDRDRLLLDPMLTETVSEDDLAMARVLLEQRPAEVLAAALVRAFRARLPEPEDVTDPGTARPKREERPGAATSRQKTFDRNDREQSGGVWFRISVGRKKNADPRWLLPMLCRRGKITKRDIGVIRIFERETKIEIASHVADDFAANCVGPGADDIRIERAAAPTPEQDATRVRPKERRKPRHAEG